MHRFENEADQIAVAVMESRGVGPAAIEALDEEFDTAEAIADASPNDLQAADGIGPALARRIHSTIRIRVDSR